MVIEHDPEAIEALEAHEIPYIYGDASDPDLLEDTKLHDAELVISTAPDLTTNRIVLSVAKRSDKNPLVILVI